MPTLFEILELNNFSSTLDIDDMYSAKARIAAQEASDRLIANKEELKILEDILLNPSEATKSGREVPNKYKSIAKLSVDKSAIAFPEYLDGRKLKDIANQAARLRIENTLLEASAQGLPEKIPKKPPKTTIGTKTLNPILAAVDLLLTSESLNSNEDEELAARRGETSSPILNELNNLLKTTR